MPEVQTQQPKDWSKFEDKSLPDENVKTGKTDKATGRVEHEVIAEQEPFKDSGKDIAQINAPIVSMHPTSGNKDNKALEAKDYEVFDEANRFLNHVNPDQQFAYPFIEMDIGQGFFAPVPPNSNIDRLIANIHKAVNAFHKHTSVEEKDENGDDVMETVTTLPKKRTPDGIIQLDSAGNPIVGANHTNRSKLIHMAQFVIKAAVKGDELANGREAESDGALVIRVA